MYRMMSFDGGGVRGIFIAKILQMLSEELDFINKTDLFIGTSTGALIALGLAAGLSSEQLVGLYKQFAAGVFTSNPQYEGAFSKVPKYDNVLLKSMLTQYVFLSNPTLANLKKKVVIFAFKLSNGVHWTHHYFHNFNDSETKHHSLVDVAMASGAAPLYFPSYQGYVDGGVFATNPSMAGLCKALEQDPMLHIQDVQLFSIGSGLSPNAIESDVSWGVKDWLGDGYPLFLMMTEGSVEAIHEQCAQVLKTSCHRLNIHLDFPVAIDDCSKVNYLIEKAEKLPKEHPRLWKKTLEWVDQHFILSSIR